MLSVFSRAATGVLKTVKPAFNSQYIQNEISRAVATTSVNCKYKPLMSFQTTPLTRVLKLSLKHRFDSYTIYSKTRINVTLQRINHVFTFRNFRTFVSQFGGQRTGHSVLN